MQEELGLYRYSRTTRLQKNGYIFRSKSTGSPLFGVRSCSDFRSLKAEITHIPTGVRLTIIPPPPLIHEISPGTRHPIETAKLVANRLAGHPTPVRLPDDIAKEPRLFSRPRPGYWESITEDQVWPALPVVAQRHRDAVLDRFFPGYWVTSNRPQQVRRDGAPITDPLLLYLLTHAGCPATIAGLMALRDHNPLWGMCINPVCDYVTPKMLPEVKRDYCPQCNEALVIPLRRLVYFANL